MISPRLLHPGVVTEVRTLLFYVFPVQYHISLAPSFPYQLFRSGGLLL